MNQKTIRHIEPSIDLSEMETGNMISILKINQTKYLNLLSERLDGESKRSYERALFEMRRTDIGLDKIEKA